VKVICSTLQLRSTIVDKSKYVLEKGGFIEREKWEYFMKWFSPLITPVNLNYQGQGEEQPPPEDIPPNAYTFDEIVDSLSPHWFYGHLGTNETAQILHNLKPGSFLFRFSSSTPKTYTLSVVTETGIAHWRITTDKKTGFPPIFKIGNVSYKSLAEIIRTHGVHQLENTGVLLLFPCDRTKNTL